MEKGRGINMLANSEIPLNYTVIAHVWLNVKIETQYMKNTLLLCCSLSLTSYSIFLYL